jgi:hypothetical protein
MEIRQVFTKVEEDNKTRDTGLLVTEECQMFITEEVGYYSNISTLQDSTERHLNKLRRYYAFIDAVMKI